MSAEIRNLIDSYHRWLKDNTGVRQVGETWSEVTTPFLDRHNDHLQILVRKQDNGYLLTDDGFTIDDLEMSGVSLASPRRRALLQQSAAGFGVKVVEDRRLEVVADPNDFARKKHGLVQAMLAVNDLFCLASETVESLFIEDVTSWLEKCDVRFTPAVKLAGQTGFDHRFDFVIPRSRSGPERLLRAINRPNRNAAESFILAWTDTRDARAAESQAIALLNDDGRPLRSEVLEALRRYEIAAVPWSERDHHLPSLLA